ncbi:MAG TPA: hypothetical protein VMR81_03060 [Patescibacteria group bacterium]|nr:hypothetical protein [Patescibacteria group bacterium]
MDNIELGNIIGIRATLHITKLHGETPSVQDLEGLLDGNGTFHYLDNELYDGCEGAMIASIPNANQLVGDAIITLTDSNITIKPDRHGGLIVTEPTDWIQQKFNTNEDIEGRKNTVVSKLSDSTKPILRTQEIKPEIVKRKGAFSLIPAYFNIAQDIYHRDENQNVVSKRVVVVFEAGIQL